MKGLLKKLSFKKIRFSRKTVFILAGVLLFAGASGGVVLYFFADKVTGTEEVAIANPNGVACLDVQTEVIQKVDRFWIRKYISSDDTDGPDRARTAMRVALAIQEKEKPDLVQVVVLDGKGPKTRAEARGRAVGANVLLISNREHLPKDLPTAAFSVRYVDGKVGPDGLFYGQRIDMEEADAQALAHSIVTRDLCGDLTNASTGGSEGHGGGHDAPAEGGHGGGHDAPAEGHDAAPAEGHSAPEGKGTGDEHASL